MTHGSAYRYNLVATYQILCNEPFGLTRDEVSNLTDDFIRLVYWEPARERERERKRREHLERGDMEIPDELTLEQEKQAYIDVGSALGGSPEHWAAEWDKWIASENGQKAIARDKRRKRRMADGGDS